MKRNNYKRFSILVLLLSTVIVACSSVEEDKQILGNLIVQPESERNQIIRNPLCGWAIYSDARIPDMEFWNKFDNLTLPDQRVLKVSDYATHLYIRWPWSVFEKEEGVYAWDYDDFFKLLENGAEERGLKLAFRIYVDSRDYSKSSTPEYVREAGAKGFIGNTNQWSPYADDPIFQKKYEKFLNVFSQRYNDPDRVDFIDGYGLGKWGEGHSVKYIDDANREKTFKWIIDLYTHYFTDIAIAINYHRLIGIDKDWSAPDPQSASLLQYAFNKCYILRQDAFGMGDYYGEFEKQIAKEYFPDKPIIAESGWWHVHDESSSWKSDPNGYTTWRDVWKQTLTDALTAHANTLDLRNISEAKSWFETSFDLVEKFISEGGYRIYPDSISLPEIIINNSEIEIIHRWANLGVGVCPSNIPQWKDKYKVAFALLDKNTKIPKFIFVDTKTNPSHWLKTNSTTYRLLINPENIPSGEYVWGVAIVDVRKNNSKGINLAVKKSEITNSGWFLLSEVDVK